MRLRWVGLGLLGACVVGAEACVGDLPSFSSQVDDAGPVGDAATTDASSNDDAEAGPQGPFCRSDQIVCDGACVDIGPQHCGSCTTVCPASAPLCSTGAGSAPGCVSQCNPGQTPCGAQCVDTTSNPSNCGGCGNKCTTPLNGTATCANNTCDFTCKPSYHPCGAECAADDDTTKCGATCKTCLVPDGGTAVCTGSCSFTCGGGLTVCATQGLCANVTNDKSNCGVCGKACAIAPSCTSGACVVKYGNYTPYTAEQTAVANAEFTATRVDTPQTLIVTQLGAYVRAFSNQYEMWLGLYNDNGGHPGSLLASAKILVTATGAKELSIPATTIPAGTYYIGATQSDFANYGMNSSVGTYEYKKDTTTPPWNSAAAPNPAPITATFGGSVNFYFIGKE